MSGTELIAAGHSQGLPCPVCRVDLVMSERNGIEIDYCPKCRGVWLDRGELDKIIERSAADETRYRPAAEQAPQPAHSQPYNQQGGHGSGYGHDNHGYSSGHGSGRRHGSFLGRLFD